MPRVLTGSALVLLVSLFALQAPTPGQTPALETAFVCPMHPDYTLDVEGRCPRCGMALVRATPYDVRDYGFDFTTAPLNVLP